MLTRIFARNFFKLFPLVFTFLALLKIPFVQALHNVTLPSPDPSIRYVTGSDGAKWVPIQDVNAIGGGYMLIRSTNATDGTATIFQTCRSIYYFAPLWPFEIEVQITINGQRMDTFNLQDTSVPAITPPDVSGGLGPSSQLSQVRWSMQFDSDAQRTIVVTAAASKAAFFTALVDGFLFEVADQGDPPPSITKPQLGPSTTVTPTPSSTPSSSTSSSTPSSRSQSTTIGDSTFSPVANSSSTISLPTGSSSPTPSAESSVGVSSSASDTNPQTLHSTNRMGIIIGSACGAVALIILLLMGLWFTRRKQNEKPGASVQIKEDDSIFDQPNVVQEDVDGNVDLTREMQGRMIPVRTGISDSKRRGGENAVTVIHRPQGSFGENYDSQNGVSSATITPFPTTPPSSDATSANSASSPRSDMASLESVHTQLLPNRSVHQAPIDFPSAPPHYSQVPTQNLTRRALAARDAGIGALQRQGSRSSAGTMDNRTLLTLPPQYTGTSSVAGSEQAMSDVRERYLRTREEFLRAMDDYLQEEEQQQGTPAPSTP
ncbi:hypothetical protein CVT24_005840 [Panaeolus cyanescens]|uniref:Mid2 domain-containing protein n=1 Tax=Panaeolus cyanescens TaxID=181874 RepID=A0A409YF68_9AGAR|nr:hypothetical protein CVT24_005840 [Panaeolus cyanescens]